MLTALQLSHHSGSNRKHSLDTLTIAIRAHENQSGDGDDDKGDDDDDRVIAIK
jgi:hypothetical protein